MKDLLKSKTISLFLIIVAIVVISWAIDKPLPEIFKDILVILFPTVALKESHKKHIEVKKDA